jgi:hypothetical protein
LYFNVFGYWRRLSDCQFILLTTSLVVTTITFYSIARLHNFQSLDANLFSLSVIVFITHFTSSQADLLYSSVDMVPLFIFSERLTFT